VRTSKTVWHHSKANLRSYTSTRVRAADRRGRRTVRGCRRRLWLTISTRFGQSLAIDLLGHSDGGTIAIDYAVRHGDHLRKLVVVDGRVIGDPNTKAAREAMLKLWADDPHFKAAIHNLQIMPDGSQMTDAQFSYWLDAIIPLYLSDPDRLKPLLKRTMEGTDLKVWAASAEDESVEKGRRDQLATARMIRARTLIMNGTVDWICPYQTAQNLHAAIPGSHLSLYANKGHFPWLEDPSRFYQEVAQFLSDDVS
jgi:proline iminopeptidase